MYIVSSIGTVIVGIVYGYEIGDENDVTLAVCEQAMTSVEFLISNTFLVEYLPFLAHMPTWLPFTSFLRRLQDLRRCSEELRDMPWTIAKDTIVGVPSLVGPKKAQQ